MNLEHIKAPKREKKENILKIIEVWMLKIGKVTLKIDGNIIK